MNTCGILGGGIQGMGTVSGASIGHDAHVTDGPPVRRPRKLLTALSGGEQKRRAMTLRTDVYAAIDGERDYQDRLSVGPNGRTDGKEKSVGDYLTLLAVYLHKAQAAYAGNPGNMPSVHEVRKIAALAVQMMEVHGAPRRGDPV